MHLNGVPGMLMGFLSPRKKHKDIRQPIDLNSHTPRTESLPHTSTPPRTLSSNEPDCSAALPAIIISSPGGQQTTADPTTGPLPHLLVQSGLVTSRTTTSASLPHSANRRNSSGTGSSPLQLQRDIPQDLSTNLDPYVIQSAIFRGDSFTNSHHIVIQNANMNDGIQREEWRHFETSRTEQERQEQEEEQMAKTLKKLAEKGLSGALLDSKERPYPPRCNENTRETLRRQIAKWGRNDAEFRRLFWLSGPAAVGKSAVAQTVAEEFKQEGLLGAAFFFSRPSNRSDPDVVIPTLAYQLALLLPEYLRAINKRLIADPLILNKTRSSQFKELVVDPFLVLTFNQPLLIIIDGLDECHDRQAQCEFVEMISHFVRTEPHLKLRWIICSRPEPHLLATFSRVEIGAICFREKLEVDDREAQKDAKRILETGFADIRKRFPEQLAEDWPAEDQINYIAERASGHLGFASFIIRFIGDDQYDDPPGQLETCLKFLKRTGDTGDLNPLHALDLLYARILSDIPAAILPTTRRIVGLCILYGNQQLTAVTLANFLGLTQASFYGALRRLYSVLFIPSVLEAGEKSIRIYHASFSDFLRDPVRSREMVLDEAAVHLDVATQSLKWLRFCRKDIFDVQDMLDLTWIPPALSRFIVIRSICQFSFTPCWKACRQVSKDSLEALIRALENFDFDLDYQKWWRDETREFAYFIRWLAELGPESKSLLVIESCEGEYLPVTQDGYITFVLKDDDPYVFAKPFTGGSGSATGFTVYLRLGKTSPVPFQLRVASPAFALENSFYF